jgi:flagellar motor protein MotB
MEEAVAVERLYQLAMQVAQVDPNILQIINHDKAIRLRAELLGVPKTVLKGEDEVEAEREAAALQQMMQQQMMVEQHQADVAAKQAKTATEFAKPETRELTEQAVEIAEEEEI